MKTEQELKKLTDEVIFSYEQKAEEHGLLFDVTDIVLGKHEEKEERQELKSQIRDILARNEHLRRKDFDRMMESILLLQNQRENQIKRLLKNYFESQKDIAKQLKDNLRKFRNYLLRRETQRVRESQNLISKVLNKQDKRKEAVITELKAFRAEQKELTYNLRKLLAKGRQLRIKDLKAMLESFRLHRARRISSQKQRKEKVTQMLDGFSKKRYSGGGKRNKKEGKDGNS